MPVTSTHNHSRTSDRSRPQATAGSSKARPAETRARPAAGDPKAAADRKAERSSDRYVRGAKSTSGAYDAIRARPSDPRVALAALETTEDVLADVGKDLLKDDAFLKRAIVANPFVLLNEGANDWQRQRNIEAIPAARRARLLKDPAVAAAVNKTRADLAALPDLDPKMFSLNRRFFGEIVRNRLQPDAVDPRPTAVVIYPREDWNGEFSVLQEEYAKQHRLMFYRVTTDAEATQALDQATRSKPASLVMLGGHGEQQLMAFGADDPRLMPPEWQKKAAKLAKTADGQKKLGAELERVNEGKYYDFSDEDLLRPLRDRIASDGHLVLMSCSTGKGKRSAKNLANFMHRMFPQATVYAPTEPVPNNGMQWDDSGRFVGTSFAMVGKEYRIGPGGKIPARSHDLRAAVARGEKF